MIFHEVWPEYSLTDKEQKSGDVFINFKYFSHLMAASLVQHATQFFQ